MTNSRDIIRNAINDCISAPSEDVEKAAEAVLAALAQDAWYCDVEGEFHESAEDALAPVFVPPGSGERLSQNICLNDELYYLLPTLKDGTLCPCGEPKGCGDFLGEKCVAEREKAFAESELPAEWREKVKGTL